MAELFFIGKKQKFHLKIDWKRKENQQYIQLYAYIMGTFTNNIY